MRFENWIKICRPRKGVFTFVPSTGYVRIRNVITSRGFGDLILYENSVCTNLQIKNPNIGCTIMAEIDVYVTRIQDEPRNVLPVDTSRVGNGYAAFVFNGKTLNPWHQQWQPWCKPHDVEVDCSATHGLLMLIVGSNGKIFAHVSSRDKREFLGFEHMLDYCTGKRSLGDILALVEMEKRSRLCGERELIYRRLLSLIRRFKGANPGRSRAADEMEKLAMELLGEKFPA